MVEDLSIGEDTPAVLSPNGRRLAYIGTRGLWVRELASLQARLLQGTAGARVPIWSPDGANLRGVQLWKIGASGGDPIQVATLPDEACGAPTGAWEASGRILWSMACGVHPLLSVSAHGGEMAAVLKPDVQAGERDFHGLSALPDARGVLFVVCRRDGRCGDTIDVWTVNGRTRVLQLTGEGLASPIYSPSGHVLFERRGKNEVSGRSGSRSIVSSQTVSRFWSQAAWASRASPPMAQMAVRIAFEKPNAGVWVLDVARGFTTRLTLGPDTARQPSWSADGSRVYYHLETPGGRPTIAATNIASPGSSEPVVEGRAPAALSRDGRWLVYAVQNDKTDIDLWRKPLPNGPAVPVVQDAGAQTSPALSPDGRLLAYVSADAGKTRLLVASDGRLLVARQTERETKPSVFVVQNWFAEFADGQDGQGSR